MIDIKKVVIILFGLMSFSIIYANHDLEFNIQISNIKTTNNKSTILVLVKNVSSFKSTIIQPRNQQDSISLFFPWSFRIMQSNVEFSSKTVSLVYGYSGKVYKIKKGKTIEFKIDILWDYMIDDNYNPINRDRKIYITLLYDLFNKKFRSNTIEIQPPVQPDISLEKTRKTNKLSGRI